MDSNLFTAEDKEKLIIRSLYENVLGFRIKPNNEMIRLLSENGWTLSEENLKMVMDYLDTVNTDENARQNTPFAFPGRRRRTCSQQCVTILSEIYLSEIYVSTDPILK